MAKKRFAAVTLFLLTLVLGLTVPAAAQYPPTEGDLQVSATVVSAGQSITVSGDGFCPNRVVSITLTRNPSGTPQPIGSFTTDAQGKFSGSVTIPSTTQPGSYTLKANSTDKDCVRTRVLSAALRVRSARALSATGADVMPWLLAAAGAILIGTLFVVAARRRRTTSDKA